MKSVLFESISSFMIFSLAIFCVLFIWILQDRFATKKKYGDFYNEDHFREHYSNQCLVTLEEKKNKGLPEWIRYKAFNVDNSSSVYLEGNRVNDRVFYYEDNTAKNGKIISFKSFSSFDTDDKNAIIKELHKYKDKHFIDCVIIAELKIKEGKFFYFIIEE